MSQPVTIALNINPSAFVQGLSVAGSAVKGFESLLKTNALGFTQGLDTGKIALKALGDTVGSVVRAGIDTHQQGGTIGDSLKAASYAAKASGSGPLEAVGGAVEGLGHSSTSSAAWRAAPSRPSAP